MALVDTHNPWTFIPGLLGVLLSFAVFLYAGPTFYVIWKNKSAEGFNSIPYVLTLFSAQLWLYYATQKTIDQKIVKNVFFLIIVNSFCCFLEFAFICIFVAFASKQSRMLTAKLLLVMNLGGFCLIVLLCQFLAKGYTRSNIIGGICVGVSVCVAAAPLYIIKTVIKTRSVKYMPLSLSLIRTINAGIWFLYGLARKDIYGFVPNGIGFILGVLQIIVFIVYKCCKTAELPEVTPDEADLVINVETDLETAESMSQLDLSTDPILLDSETGTENQTSEDPDSLLMQFISGKNIKGSSAELQSNVMPWDGSAELLSSMQTTEATLNQALPDQADGSSRLTNTLVALKSSQIAAASISPGLEISPEDLSSVETSISCFSKLSSAVATASQAEALLAILEGWEELFEAKKADLLPSDDATDQGNDWGNDDWNDGWETLQELEPVEKEKKEYVVLAHPLHACWLDIFRKYVALSMPENVLRLIDGSLQKPEEVLVEENEAESLAGILASTDPFLALKISLLLPYERIRSQCLNVVEEQLKQAGIPELSSQSHHEVLLLVIYSGTLSTIISNSCYGSVFSFLCYLIGKLSREFQEERVTQSDNRESNASSEKRFTSCFGELMFPCFVSELVKADQQILAGFLVTKFMHSNPSLSLINVAEASLRRYLDKQLESLEHSFTDNSELETLKHTVSRLRGNSKEVIQSALASLSSCTNSR